MFQLLLSVLGIYVCFLTWGITQERVTTTSYNGEKFSFFFVLNVVQSLCAVVVGVLFIKLQGKPLEIVKKGTFKSILWISLMATLASPFGYASLKHIDYPTMILGKSCKLVPVMLMNFLLYRRTFKFYKYVAVILITAGVSSFMLLHPQEGKKKGAANSLFGIFLLSLNLLLDGVINSTQDQLFHKFKISGASLMVAMNLFSSLNMLLYLFAGPYLPAPFLSNEFADATRFLSAHPAVLYDILLFGLCGALGQCFIFYTLEKFGALVLVTVTVTRKMFSILLSAFWFNHQFTIGQWAAVGTVFLGIGLETVMKQREKKQVDSTKKKKKQ